MGAEGKGMGGILVVGEGWRGNGWVGRKPWRKEGAEKRKEEPKGRGTIGAFRSQRLAVYN